MTIKSNLIEQINHYLDLFEGKPFSESREFHASPDRRFSASIQLTDEQKKINLIGCILKRSSQLALRGYGHASLGLDMFDIRTRGQMSIYAREYTVLDGQVDPKFIAKIREYVHVYFYSMVSRLNLMEREDDKGSVLWEKRKHPVSLRDEYEVLSFLAREAEVALTVSSQRNWSEVYIAGSQVEFERLIDFIEETAGGISPSLLKDRISIGFLEDRSIGRVSIKDLKGEIRKELLMKAEELRQI
jgi:hypothetical protein